MIKSLFPVVLAGGFGTRLWPLSRKTFPKQFLRLQDAPSLLLQTIQRIEQLDCSQTIIEVQTGDYLGEDDIQRFDDKYERRV